jgi:hypothetical protein
MTCPANDQPRIPNADQLRSIYEANGRNAQRTADELGVPVSTLKSSASYREVRSPFIVTGRSTLRNLQTGEDMLVWEKESLDKEKAEEARQAAYEAMAGKLPRIAPVAPPKAVNGDLCNLYTFTDYHLGCLAWREEGGADWDLKIAERTLIGGFRAMVSQSPKAHTAVINLQGDFLHTDGLVPATPAHGHILDADSRYPKIVAVAIRAIRQLVSLALERHEDVRLIIAEGNHDESGSVWLRQMFSALYEDEPRVSVDTSALPFYTFLWGETFLGFHHGHKVKNEHLPLLFAAQFRSAWGSTSKAYIHCGHRHHCDEKEYNGATVIQHPTLAARDAYAARGGWIAERAAQSITYHRRFGQVGRVMVTPEMLAA